MRSVLSHEEGAQVNQASTTTGVQETQGVDLSEHHNPTVTPMERAQALWAKLLVDGGRMVSRPFDNFQRPVLSKVNARENEPWGDPITEKLPNITRVYCINLNGLTLDSRGGNLTQYVVALKKSRRTFFADKNTNWIPHSTK